MYFKNHEYGFSLEDLYKFTEKYKKFTIQPPHYCLEGRLNSPIAVQAKKPYVQNAGRIFPLPAV